MIEQIDMMLMGKFCERRKCLIRLRLNGSTWNISAGVTQSSHNNTTEMTGKYSARTSVVKLNKRCVHQRPPVDPDEPQRVGPGESPPNAAVKCFAWVSECFP